MIPQRLRTTANYSQFHPQAIACQTLPPSSSNYNGNNLSAGTRTLSSLAAISSPSGILLCSTHAPYEPTLILSHHNSSQYSSAICNYLSFSTQKSQNKLASTHSDSVLIWDTSGQSLQPLLARLSTRNRQQDRIHRSPNSSSSASSYIALEWNKQNETILTSTHNTISMWDIRSHTNRIRPACTFISSGQATIVSIASSFIDHEFACIDSNGTVRIYDDRMNQFKGSTSISASASGELVQFWAHNSGGIGVTSVQMDHHKNDCGSSEGDHRGYITWGLDSQNDGTFSKIVKVWKKTAVKNNQGPAFDTDAYWYMGNGGDAKEGNEGIRETKTMEGATVYECCSDKSIDNLSSVRVCPKPFQSGIVTVSAPKNNVKNSTWKVDLWSLGNEQNSGAIENVASFCNTDDALTNMTGEDFEGRHLIASELTVGSALSLERHEIKPSSTSAEGRDLELLICCLDNAGFFTTYAITEASSLHDKKSKAIGQRNESEQQFYFQHGVENKGLKVFQQSGSDPDLVSKDGGQSDTDLHYDKLKLSNTAAIDQHIDTVEGGFVQTRMEDDLFYDKDLDLDDDLNNIQVHNNRGVDSSQDLDLIHEDEPGDRDVSAKIDPVKAMHVPCPRLCGATFGTGGGMISFHNGEVKKMWNWFSSSDSSHSQTSDVRHSTMKKKISADSLDVLQYFQNEKDRPMDLDSDEGPDTEREKDKSGGFPRSLCDLMKMNEAAKFAQWGDEDEDNEDDIGESSQSDDEADISDDGSSDDSSSSSDDFGDVNDDFVPNERADAMCEDYFGKNAGSFGLPQYSTSIFERKVRIKNRPRSDSMLGPTTESLVPVVFFTTKYDHIILNGQSPQLADLWLLGPWTHEDEEISIGIQDNSNSESNTILINEEWKEHSPISNFFPSLSRTTSMKKAESSGSVIHNQSQSQSTSYPNLHKRRHTMFGNLKMYYYDQKGAFIPPPSTSSIPLDDELTIPTNSEIQQPQVSDRSLNELDIATVKSSNARNIAYLRRLNRAKDICICNGKAALNFRQHKKADVWNLLAEILDNIASGIGDEYDGWKGLSSGSLGRNLLQEILTYYEREGDVQMLATIVSVIGRGRNSLERQTNLENDEELLVTSDYKRCDIYIYLYANMLYSWGRNERSAELKKHLHYPPSDTLIAESCGLMFAPRCLQCDDMLSPKTKICPTCNVYAFQCSICTNSVRGLYTVCFLCGHGGHFEHLMQWFSEQTVCPTGCGCSCTFNTFNTINTFSGSAEKKTQQAE